MRFLKSLNPKGDTIVEVMIVTIIIAVIMGSAYGLAVRSLQDTQLSQERAYALKLAEGQLEELKAAASSSATVGFLTNSAGFCLNSDAASGALNSTTLSPGLPADSLEASRAGLSSYDAACKISSNNDACASFCYYVSLNSVSGVDHSYTATVRWESPRGELEQVQLSGKVYPDA
ncbi:MAG: hypothetical protein WCJ24_02415 [Candidatus Saccharibacteria bacterium]